MSNGQVLHDQFRSQAFGNKKFPLLYADCTALIVTIAAVAYYAMVRYHSGQKNGGVPFCDLTCLLPLTGVRGRFHVHLRYSWCKHASNLLGSLRRLGFHYTTVAVGPPVVGSLSHRHCYVVGLLVSECG